MKVAIISPVPAAIAGRPESGVAHYTHKLIRSASGGSDITVIGQASAPLGRIGGARVLPTWTPDLRLPGQVDKALAALRPDIVHVQHEFNLYGGLLAGGMLTGALFRMHWQGTKILTTVHGVVHPDEVNLAFLRRNGLPSSPRLVRVAFQAAYRTIAASSDLLIVHHDYFRDLLIDCYGVQPRKVQTIRPGADRHSADQLSPQRPPEPVVLILGFLTGYKLPEIVVDVAESSDLPNIRFRFCVGRNPRLVSPEYEARYQSLERRVRRLSAERAEWSGYIPDAELTDAFCRASVLVLPYTECLSTSAVAGGAADSGIPICYSRPLRPLFGASPLEFELSRSSLAVAIKAALTGAEAPATGQFGTWEEAARLTEHWWRRLASN